MKRRFRIDISDSITSTSFDCDMLKLVNNDIPVGSFFNLEGPLLTNISRAIRQAYNYITIPDSSEQSISIKLNMPFDSRSDIDRLYIGPRPRRQLSGIFKTVSDEIYAALLSKTNKDFHIDSIVRYICYLFGIPFHHNQSTSTLSGGEVERLMLALCAISSARAYAFDMAFSAQDERHSKLCQLFLERFTYATDRLCLSISQPKTILHLDVNQKHPAILGEFIGTINEGYFKLSDDTKIAHFPKIDIYGGSITMITGQNGSGKTLLGRYILDILPKEIKVSINHYFHNNLNHNIKRGYLPQDPSVSFKHNSVHGELLEQTHLQQRSWYDFKIKQFISDRCDISKSPFEISISDQKWLAFIKAFGNDPDIIFLDEPSEYWTNEEVIYFIDIISRIMSPSLSIFIASHDVRLINGLNNHYYKGDSEKYVYKNISLSGDLYVQEENKNMVVLKQSSIDLNCDLAPIWDKIHEEWPKKQLDFFDSWKRHIDPCLKMVSGMIPENTKRYLDLGCGNGLQTLYMRGIIQDLHHDTDIFTVGIDWSNLAIDAAILLNPHWINSRWLVADICNVNIIDDLDGCLKYDVISSFFTLHDVISASKLMITINQKMEVNGVAYLALINPLWVFSDSENTTSDNVDFHYSDADWYGTCFLKLNDNDSIKIPYFHRRWVTYENIINDSGLCVAGIYGVNQITSEIVSYHGISDIDNKCKMILLCLKKPLVA
jgi:energy-coupling factor transporter ATP-binding protein EcfA2/SAM-dependent methyltransferase